MIEIMLGNNTKPLRNDDVKQLRYGSKSHFYPIHLLLVSIIVFSPSMNVRAAPLR